MRICVHCSTDYPADARFCQRCGQPLARACQVCNTANLIEAHHCVGCGNALEENLHGTSEDRLRSISQVASQGLLAKMRKAGLENKGERKPVSILFVDVVGSTSMAEKLDPEDWQAIIAGAHRCIGKVIYRYEGTVAQLLGDGMLAFFGAPISHEDDPIRAVRAALDVHEAINGYRQTLVNSVDDFQVRAGISTGTVVIGDIGTDMHVEYLAFGDAVNVAARLQGEAEPGEVLITAETHKRIAPCFETLNLGEIPVKGKSVSVQAYRVLAVRSQAQTQRGIPGLTSPLVGRSAEVEALDQAGEQLFAGSGGVLSVVGEAGIGKSRLIDEFRARINDVDLRWIEGRCLSYGGSTPYLLWVDILQGLLGLNVTESPPNARLRLHHLVTSLCPSEYERVFPFLGSLLSLPLDDEHTAKIQNLNAEDLRDSIFHAVCVVIECVANASPLVLICEDLHWADPTSLALLERIQVLTSRVPLLILRLMRPEGDCWDSVLSRPASRSLEQLHTQLRLSPLTEQDVQQLVDNLLPTAAFPASLSQNILSYADGNPFYVEEILRSWIDGGVISRDEERHCWTVSGDFQELDVPDTVQGVLLARMDRLPWVVRRVLQIGAVIGRTFDLKVLENVSSLSSSNLGACLGLLEQREFIHATADGTGKAYTFRHALTQEVAYETLLRRHRRRLHKNVGTALEALSDQQGEEGVEILAFHFLRAEVWDKAWDYHLLAGRKAKEQFANQEAASLLEQALEIARHLPALGRSDQADVCCLIAEIWSRTNHYAAALGWLEQGLEILSAEAETNIDRETVAQVCQQKGQVLRSMGEYASALDVIQEGLDALQGDCQQKRGALKIAMASTLTRMGELEYAQQWCTNGISDAERCRDFAELAHGYSLLGTIRRHFGDTAGSLTWRQRSLEISQEINDIPLQMEAHNNLAVAYYDLGQLENAIEHYQHSLELSDVIGNLNTAARARINLGEVYWVQGDWDKAEHAFSRALTTWDQTGYSLGQAYGAANMGAVLCLQGMPEEAKGYLQRSEQLFSELGARSFLPTVDCYWASAYLKLGELDSAESYCQRALKLARELSLLHPEGFALRMLGEINRERGSLAKAKSNLNQSIRIFKEAGVCYEEARGLKELARVYVAAGRFERAKPILDQAIDLFEGLGARFDLKDAQALATRLPR